MKPQIQIGDYTDDAGNTDWEALHQTRAENGEICSICRNYVSSHRYETSAYICNGCQGLGVTTREEYLAKCPQPQKPSAPQQIIEPIVPLPAS